MKHQADKRRSERQFQEGDWVWLKLRPYRQASVQHRSNVKLGRQYFGPFQISDTVGKVAYKLNIPSSAQNSYHSACITAQGFQRGTS